MSTQCFLEKLFEAYNNGDVVDRNEQPHLAALGPLAFLAEVRFTVTSDHTESGRDLPSQTSEPPIEVCSRPMSTRNVRQLGCRPVVSGRRDRLDMVTLACIRIVGFVIIGRASQRALTSDLLGGGRSFSQNRLTSTLDVPVALAERIAWLWQSQAIANSSWCGQHAFS